MSAASVLPIHHQQQPSAAQSSFSALTLFESTLLNAGMLLDSMTLDELVAARPCKLEPKEPLLGVKLEQQHQQLHQQTLGHVDSFASDAGGASSFPGDDEDDDCLLLEEESSFSGGAGACAAGGPSNVDVRNLLKDTYKNLRGSGPHLFDFAKPFEHPMNQMVAKKVIDQAQAVSGIAANAEVWRTTCQKEYGFLQQSSLRSRLIWRKSNRQKAKLSRRQKAFETLLPNLSPDDLEHYRIVLTRDLTSSDEEEEDETLRVRCLAWESDRVRDIKRSLDEAFMRRFATVKQRAQLGKCVRDEATRSQRPIPAGTPEWVIRPAFLP
uniref:Uncharacterized protein n=1 Tax=Macrostomum lignano TaxID=282301 RepID=A0A1I8GSM9_9PLAT